MEIKLSNYSYSYASAVGNTLKQPLFKLVSNIAIAASQKSWESRAQVITKVALHCLLAVLFVIPAGLAWLAGKSLCYLSKTQINPKGLHLAPPRIEIPQEMQAGTAQEIMHLSTKFNKLTAVDAIGKQGSFFRLCDWIVNTNPNIYPNDTEKRNLFCKQMSILLRSIIKKIENGEISEDKERDLLMELAETSTRCWPTWLEVTTRLYAEVNGQSETVEVKLLRLVQEYKETITLEFCQNEANAQWHALNYVRNILGKELGMNTDLNGFDPYVDRNDPVFGKSLTKWLFLQKYENVNRLITSVQTMINSRNYDVSYYDFLVDFVKQKGVEHPEEYVPAHFYDADYKLNELGVNAMLKAIGILK